MTQTCAEHEELRTLIAEYREGTLSSERAVRLNAVLADSSSAREVFARYAILQASLELAAGVKPHRTDADDEAASLPPRQGIEFSPLSAAPTASFSFVDTPVFSYLVATLILGMLLLSAWSYKVSHDGRDVVNNNRRGPTAPGESGKTPELAFVGRVTGMKDCRWADPRTETYLGASVSLNRKYTLLSGLLEIAYKTGAKVILEGPCVYEVDSDAGGFLSLGKLTARVDVAKPQAAKTQAPRPKTQDQNPKSPSSLIPHPSSLFTVRTPTAVVTDLGTEFGVEVSEEGNTTSHVFQGKVVVRVGDSGMRDERPAAASAGVASGEAVQLNAGQSVRVKKDDKTGAPRILTGNEVGAAPKFVRRIHEPPKLLDLLDIVAGGNGTGKRRERGIDPSSGVFMPKFVDARCVGDGQCRPVVWQRMIDGVFIPDGGAGTVQLDSAGHVFDGFPDTVGRSWGSIWSRAAKVEPEDGVTDWVHTITNAKRFMPDGRGLLAFCPNVGLTFDLDTVRKTFAESRPTRFYATAGVADSSRAPPSADGLVDLWIFVDGRLAFKRIGLSRKDGVVNLNVELNPADRFLTLVSTDGGDGIIADWLVLGDPVLRMSEDHESQPKENNRHE